MQVDLPSTIVHPDSVQLDQLIELLPKDFAQAQVQAPAADDSMTIETVAPPGINKDALTLALFGWEAEAGHIKGLVACNACFRRLGLWLFLDQPRSSSPTAKDDDDPQDDGPSVTALDVVNEHRDYCPWINAASQNGNALKRKPVNGGEEKAGWEILLRVLSTAHHFRVQPATVRTHSISVDQLEAQGKEDARPASSSTADTRTEENARDKERWAKLKNLKKAFDVKSGRKK